MEAFGNLDKNKEYPITQDAIDKGLFVVKHFKNFTEQLPSGKISDRGVEDPSTARIGVYTQNTYEEFIRENEKENKINTFVKMGLKTVVLHDPTKEPAKVEGSNNDNSGNNETQLGDLTMNQLKDLLATYEVSEEDFEAVKKANKPTLIEIVTKYQTSFNQ